MKTIRILCITADYKGKWKELFGNDNPIYLEIGCGKGPFYFTERIIKPDINFIGVERQSTIAATAARNVGSAKMCSLYTVMLKIFWTF